MAYSVFKSVNINDILISERTMSSLIMELLICLRCTDMIRAQANTAPMCHQDTPRSTKTVLKRVTHIYLTYVLFRFTFCSKIGAKPAVS